MSKTKMLKVVTFLLWVFGAIFYRVSPLFAVTSGRSDTTYSMPP